MYDRLRINKIIIDIEEYFTRLKGINLTKDNLEIDEKFFSVSMILFSILNRMVDLAGEIIIKNEFGMPGSYEQYFDVLKSNGIIDKTLSDNLKRLVKDRNLFAHEYYNLQRSQVLRISKDIYFVKDFVEKVKKEVERRDGKK